MQTSPEISVVIPTYNNSFDELERSIKSVLAQKADFELVLVDDGSTDEVAVYLDEWSRKDSRITVLHNEKRGGVSSARNKGIKEAKGHYVAFLDADDAFKENFLNYMLEAARETSSDIVFGGVERTLLDGSSRFEKVQDLPKGCPWITLTGDRKQYFQASLVDERILSSIGLKPMRYVYVWGNLYRTTTIKAIAFDESVVISEDVIFNWMAVAASSCVALTNNVGYCYYLNDLSATRKLRPNALQEMTHVANCFAELQASAPNLPYIDAANQVIYICFCQALNYGPMRKGFREACHCSKNTYLNELLDQRVFKEMFASIKPAYFSQKVLCWMARKRHTRLLLLSYSISNFLLKHLNKV